MVFATAWSLESGMLETEIPHEEPAQSTTGERSQLRRCHGEPLVVGDFSLVRARVGERRMLVRKPYGADEAADRQSRHLEIDVAEREPQVRLHERKLRGG
jgi:hypothetical protein